MNLSAAPVVGRYLSCDLFTYKYIIDMDSVLPSADVIFFKNESRMSPTVLMNGVLSDGDIFGCRREALMEKQWLERVNEQREREQQRKSLPSTVGLCSDPHLWPQSLPVDLKTEIVDTAAEISFLCRASVLGRR